MPPVSLFQLCLFEQVRHNKLRGKTHFAHFTGLPEKESGAMYDRLGKMVRKLEPDFGSDEPYTKSALDYRIVHDLGLMSTEAFKVASEMSDPWMFAAKEDGKFVLFELSANNDLIGPHPSPCFQFNNLINGMMDIVILTTRVSNGQNVDLEDVFSWSYCDTSIADLTQQGFADVLKLGEELQEAQKRLPTPDQIAAVKISLTDEMISAANKVLKRAGFTPDLVEELMAKDAHARLQASQNKRKGVPPTNAAK